MKVASTKIKQSDLEDFFVIAADRTISDTVFKHYCRSLVANARVPNRTLYHQMEHMGRGALISATSNFVMKGHGLGVLK